MAIGKAVRNQRIRSPDGCVARSTPRPARTTAHRSDTAEQPGPARAEQVHHFAARLRISPGDARRGCSERKGTAPASSVWGNSVTLWHDVAERHERPEKTNGMSEVMRANFQKDDDRDADRATVQFGAGRITSAHRAVDRIARPPDGPTLHQGVRVRCAEASARPATRKSINRRNAGFRSAPGIHSRWIGELDRVHSGSTLSSRPSASSGSAM